MNNNTVKSVKKNYFEYTMKLIRSEEKIIISTDISINSPGSVHLLLRLFSRDT